MDEDELLKYRDTLLRTVEHSRLQDLVDQAAFELEDLKSTAKAVLEFADSLERKLKLLDRGLEDYMEGLFDGISMEDAEVLYKGKKNG